MNDAQAGAMATVTAASTAPMPRLTVTTAPAMSFSSRGRWMMALEKPWSRRSPTTPM